MEDIRDFPAIRYTGVDSIEKGSALTAAVLAAALLWPQPVPADIVQDFTDSVAAEAEAAAAVKDLRPIPDEAVEGVMYPPDGRLVVIDDSVMTLAPGSKIRNLQGRIVLPATITAPVNVRYTRDLYSYVHLIWLMPGEVELEQKEEEKEIEIDDNGGDN